MKRARYLVTGCICLMLSVTPIWAMSNASAITKNQTSFKDVQQSSWYYDAVNFVSDQGIIKEVASNEFGPNDMMTRGTFILSLYHLANAPAVSHELTFSDVNKESEYAAAVEWGVENKIISGYSNTLFKPNQAITREEMVTILYKYTQHIGIDTPIEGMAIKEYEDEQSIATWARNPMRWAIGAGNVISGTNEQRLMPQAVATRAETSEILMRYCMNVLNSNHHKAVIENGKQQYTLTIDFPEYIAPYIHLEQMNQGIGIDETYSLVLFKFSRNNHSANIGSLSIYTEEQYDKLKAEGGPIPTEVFKQDGLVVAFMGLQDMPFELQTPEAELVGNYHQEVGNILKTITLVPVVN